MRVSLKKLAEFSIVVCLLWVLLEGFFLFSVGLGWEAGIASLEPFFREQTSLWVIRMTGLLSACLAFTLSILGFLSPVLSEGGEEIQMDNERGKVRVSSRTIAEYLQRRSDEIGEVEALKIKVMPQGGKVSLQVDVSVMGDAPLPELTRKIQEFVEMEVKETIGLETIESIDINFKKIGTVVPRLALEKSEETSGGDEREALPANAAEAGDGELKG